MAVIPCMKAMFDAAEVAELLENAEESAWVFDPGSCALGFEEVGNLLFLPPAFTEQGLMLIQLYLREYLLGCLIPF